MMVDHSRHVHPEQAHKNGNKYNKKSSIPNSSKIWAMRNRLYDRKYNLAVWNIQFIISYSQSGSNMVEWYHRITQLTFDYVKRSPFGVNRLPVISLLQKLSHNYKRAQLVVAERDRSMEFNSNEYDMNVRMLKELDSITKLKHLRENYMDHDTGHGLIYFPKCSNDIDDFLHGFQWKQSIQNVTSLSYNDIQEIWGYIEKYENMLTSNNGSIIDDESLHFLKERLQFEVSLNKLKNIIKKYWYYDDEELYNESDIDDDDDIKHDDDYDGDVYGEHLTGKQKKLPQYTIFLSLYIIVFVHIIFTSNVYSYTAPVPSIQFVSGNNHIKPYIHDEDYFHLVGVRDCLSAEQCRIKHTGVPTKKTKRKKAKEKQKDNFNTSPDSPFKLKVSPQNKRKTSKRSAKSNDQQTLIFSSDQNDDDAQQNTYIESAFQDLSQKEKIKKYLVCIHSSDCKYIVI